MHLQEDRREPVDRLVVPPDHIAAAQPHHCRGLVLGVLLHRDPYDKALLDSVQLRDAAFDIVDEDNHVVEAGDAAAGDLAAKHLPAQQRRSAAKLHGEPHVAPKHGLGVLTVERQAGCYGLLWLGLLLLWFRLWGGWFSYFVERLTGPDLRQNRQCCTHRAPPMAAAAHPAMRASRVFRPPACFCL